MSVHVRVAEAVAIYIFEIVIVKLSLPSRRIGLGCLFLFVCAWYLGTHFTCCGHCPLDNRCHGFHEWFAGCLHDVHNSQLTCVHAV
jgi:hypothetical protein